MQRYQSAPLPRFEAERLRELYSLKLLDTQLEERFQRYTRLVADLFEVPICLISLVDRDRQWFKAACGIETRQLGRSESFCAHAIGADEQLVVEDARQDPRFADNPLVQGGPGIGFYAGHPIHGPSGLPLGTLCVIDRRPRAFDARARARLAQLAELVEHEIGQSYQLDHLRLELERSAYFDPLTGLPNRRQLTDALERAVLDADAAGRRVVLAMIDIQGFSAFNHAHGSATGDHLLRAVAAGLAREHPQPCIVGRWQDDRFALFNPEFPPGVRPEVLARELLRMFDRPLAIDGLRRHVDIKLGVSVFPTDSGSAEELIHHATAAMRSVAVGGSGFKVYHRAIESRRARRLDVGNRLRQALGDGEIRLDYQPKLDVRGERLLGAEGLVRWTDPELGPVSPEELVSVADEGGLGQVLGEKLLQMGCQQAAEWARQGLEVPMAINVTATQLRQPELVAQVERALGLCAMDGSRLTLEVTESSLVVDLEEAVRRIHELAELGVNVAIDDFGTGYSSFAYLAELPVASVKIDRRFVASAESGPTAKVVTGMIQLAHALGLQVVAEGVETAAQLDFLRQADCDEIQGFLFSRPLPPREFHRYARELGRD